MVTNAPPPPNTHLPASESTLIKAANSKLEQYKGHSLDEVVTDRNPVLHELIPVHYAGSGSQLATALKLKYIRYSYTFLSKHPKSDLVCINR
jgi:hypothetical protein